MREILLPNPSATRTSIVIYFHCNSLNPRKPDANASPFNVSKIIPGRGSRRLASERTFPKTPIHCGFYPEIPQTSTLFVKFFRKGFRFIKTNVATSDKSNDVADVNVRSKTFRRPLRRRRRTPTRQSPVDNDRRRRPPRQKRRKRSCSFGKEPFV